MSLHYKVCGLNNVWLKSGYKTHETKYGTSFSYSDIDGLYRAIAIHLCHCRAAMTPDTLRFLRKRLELSQTELGEDFGYTSQAVAKWEKGTSKIPLTVSRLLYLLCLKKFEPDISLREAFEISAHPCDRMEFEYIGNKWKLSHSNEKFMAHSEFLVGTIKSFSRTMGDYGQDVAFTGPAKNVLPGLREKGSASSTNVYAGVTMKGSQLAIVH